MPRSTTPTSIAESKFALADQLAILSHVVRHVAPFVIGKASAARLRTQAGEFETGIGVIREPALNYFPTTVVPANRSRLVKLINSDLTN